MLADAASAADVRDAPESGWKAAAEEEEAEEAEAGSRCRMAAIMSAWTARTLVF